MSEIPPKPRSETVRPKITRLPRLTIWRRGFRWFVHILTRFLLWLFTTAEVRGLEYLPHQGPALIVINHLGDVDSVLFVAKAGVSFEALAKSELYDFPVLGKIMDAFGVIWVHRGRADRKAISAGLQALKEGRLLMVAPEGRESLTGALETGTGGAAFIALREDVPIVPVTFTGTENKIIYQNMKRLRRTPVSMTVGPAFRLEWMDDRKEAIRGGTERIMLKLAQQLPEKYRGVYAHRVESN
ncbi:MAG: lysophospholipid acyltransferase family protein [Chloroflexota bacterium]